MHDGGHTCCIGRVRPQIVMRPTMTKMTIAQSAGNHTMSTAAVMMTGVGVGVELPASISSIGEGVAWEASSEKSNKRTPVGSGAWERLIESTRDPLALQGVTTSDADQCQHDRERPVPRLARRATKFMTNSAERANELDRHVREHSLHAQVRAWASRGNWTETELGIQLCAR